MKRVVRNLALFVAISIFVNCSVFIWKPEIKANAAAGTWIQASDGRWWYKHTDGSYTTNDWEKIDGYWYYFDGSGWMKTGWVYHKGDYYFCQSSGVMKEGWQYDSGKWYYLQWGTGKMAVGWWNIDGSTYYFYYSGAMCNTSMVFSSSPVQIAYFAVVVNLDM